MPLTRIDGDARHVQETSTTLWHFHPCLPLTVTINHTNHDETEVWTVLVVFDFREDALLFQ